MDAISKTQFKAHALEVLRNIEQTNRPIIITDHGKPTLEIRKLRLHKTPPLEVLRGTVIKYEASTIPVGDDDWENA